MTDSKQTPDVDVPAWDVALANLAKEEFDKKGAPLTLDDFTDLAKEYTIRLDDIMVTMFEMVIAGEWQYEGEQRIERNTLNELYVGGRLHAKDLEPFSGGWRPQD
ncbi:hypothetical protein Tel_03100 [Candidatus Tenderia electrophaga]|jgi:hypothetical protein|uniref:Uncharacterized protein n=1 Tax=Candidatus Tenderia electrophaga TaxID=1748243 RepID=A0A0S2TAQ7_9GAMM|nr:hypothetical protein Tel_03100 [Candidatus Tenderia electrophaga]